MPIFAGYAMRNRYRLAPAAGVGGCAIAQVVDTAVPYAVYGVVASFVVLLAAATRRGARGELDE